MKPGREMGSDDNKVVLRFEWRSIAHVFLFLSTLKEEEVITERKCRGLRRMYLSLIKLSRSPVR